MSPNRKYLFIGIAAVIVGSIGLFMVMKTAPSKVASQTETQNVTASIQDGKHMNSITGDTAQTTIASSNNSSSKNSSNNQDATTERALPAGNPTRSVAAATSATTSSATTAATASIKEQKPASPAHIPSCYTLAFHHKALKTHASDDECSHHRNLVKLGHADVNVSTVCIRVNGAAVHHQMTGQNDEFVIGAVAGPKDVITASFCVGKVKCTASCNYPKQEKVKRDEFLDAIGADADEADPVAAQWQAGDSAKSKEVEKALDGDLRKDLEEQEVPGKRTAANNSRLPIFRDWTSVEQSESCVAPVRDIASK